MNANAIIQYSLVGLFIIGSGIWIGIKTFRKNKKSSGCCGCAIKDSCKKKNIKSDI